MYITSDWKKRFLESDLNQYIVRRCGKLFFFRSLPYVDETHLKVWILFARYGATSTGVFLMYPGAMLDKFYDPTKRPWFTSARLHPGRVVLSAPYLDAGGAGYIVTVSHTIYEGK